MSRGDAFVAKNCLKRLRQGRGGIPAPGFPDSPAKPSGRPHRAPIGETRAGDANELLV